MGAGINQAAAFSSAPPAPVSWIDPLENETFPL